MTGAPSARAACGDEPGALAVDARRQRLLGLGLVDGGIGGGVDDDVGRLAVEGGADRGGIGEIELRPAERDRPRRPAARARAAT